jgi:four helix bundle protein
MHNYKELVIWKRAIKLTVDIYKISKEFPSDEKFGLISQMRRSSVSIPSNIAEGAGRRTDGEFANFLGIALGSVCELETQLFVAHELEYLKDDDFMSLTSELTEIQKMLYSFILKFKNKSSIETKSSLTS